MKRKHGKNTARSKKVKIKQQSKNRTLAKKKRIEEKNQNKQWFPKD